LKGTNFLFRGILQAYSGHILFEQNKTIRHEGRSIEQISDGNQAETTAEMQGLHMGYMGWNDSVLSQTTVYKTGVTNGKAK
jgi:hypothetical protein